MPPARLTRRTAVYGPVRTVVWEGRGREASPYPDWQNTKFPTRPRLRPVRGVRRA